jgi:endonuclease IV
LKLFKEIIGIEHLKAIHLNDSKGAFKCKKDRHANLGQGNIPINIFKLIMKDPQLASIPKILETPDEEKYEEEIELLKNFAK